MCSAVTMQHHESLPLTACMNTLAAMNGLTACMNTLAAMNGLAAMNALTACMNTLRPGSEGGTSYWLSVQFLIFKPSARMRSEGLL